MSLMTFFRTTILTVMLSFAVGQTSFAGTETTKSLTKADAKKTKTKAKAISKEKKAAAPIKVKAEKKVTSKTETKTKAKPKNTAAKKPTKEPKKLATADTFDKEESSFSFFTLFMVVASLFFVGTICFAIWLDYRPTVYPSGKVYGPLEYLQGPFTTEINGIQKQKTTPNAAARAARVEASVESASKVNQPAPVTVTREPVNKSAKHPAAKAG